MGRRESESKCIPILGVVPIKRGKTGHSSGGSDVGRKKGGYMIVCTLPMFIGSLWL